MDSLIQIKNLTFRYSNSRKPILKDINLEVKRGEFILIVGKSGCGKSTLARCLNGLIPHLFEGRFQGDVVIYGKNTKEYPIWELARHIGMVFQNPESQLLSLVIEEEVAFGPENFALPREVIEQRVKWALECVDMSGLRTKSVYELSDGQKQKVGIAAGLSLLPEILVFDEPASNLDPESVEEFFKVLEKIKREGKTIILTEHRTKYAARYADRVIIIDEGKIEYDGNPEILFDTQIQKIFGLRNPNWSISRTNSIVLRETNHLLLEIKNLLYSYDDEFKLEIDDMAFYKNESIGIMGSNGSGKSTLIKNIVGLLKPLKGKIVVGGIDVQKLKASEVARQIGIVLQNSDHQLFMSTVYDEVAFGFKLNNNKDVGEKANKILKMMGLWELKDRHPHSLSEGQKQRTTIASVLAREPDILILDEPTTGMDGYHMNLLINKLNELKAKGLTLILVSHDEEMLSQISDRIVILSEVKVIKDESYAKRGDKNG
jgi:energy-coupling factor transport system ATP-binding protein